VCRKPFQPKPSAQNDVFLISEFGLKSLEINVAINTIKKILIRNGFHPLPWRVKGD